MSAVWLLWEDTSVAFISPLCKKGNALLSGQCEHVYVLDIEVRQGVAV